jgi:DNA-binding MarR family transcriptional regulator
MFPWKPECAQVSKETKMPTTATPLDAHLGYWLRYVSNHVSARFRKLLDAEGISVTEWVALRTLLDDGDTSHAGLMRQLGMTKGATSKVMSRLEARGLSRRELAAGRKREQALVLTPQGRRLVPRLAVLADQNDEHFFGHLPVRQRNALLASLQALVAHHALTEVPMA